MIVVKRLHDPIEELIKSICQLDIVIRTKFTNSFLNNVAEIFERDGFGTTRAYLLEKRGRNEFYHQANALLKVLELMNQHQEIHQRRTIGRTIFKTINTLKNIEIKTMNQGGI